MPQPTRSMTRSVHGSCSKGDSPFDTLGHRGTHTIETCTAHMTPQITLPCCQSAYIVHIVDEMHKPRVYRQPIDRQFSSLLQAEWLQQDSRWRLTLLHYVVCHMWSYHATQLRTNVCMSCSICWSQTHTNSASIASASVTALVWLSL